MQRHPRVANARRPWREELRDDDRLASAMPGRVVAASATHGDTHIEPVGREQASEQEEGRRAVQSCLAQRKDREKSEAAYRDQPIKRASLGEVDERFKGAGI